MFIQTELTPNPETLKFLPNRTVNEGEPVNFTKSEDYSISPLATALFNIKDVRGVFLGSDFITITKEPEASFELMKPEILMTMMDHFVANIPVLLQNKQAASNENDSEIVKQIKELIETRVRPAVAQDGGDIIFESFENGILRLQLHGACSGCPSSAVTLKDGIENMLKYYVPEIESVEAV